MDFEQHLKGISIMRVLLYITKDKVLIFHHFRFGSFDLVGCVAELNVQYMHLQQFCTFAFQCVCIFAFFLGKFQFSRWCWWVQWAGGAFLLLCFKFCIFELLCFDMCTFSIFAFLHFCIFSIFAWKVLI